MQALGELAIVLLCLTQLTSQQQKLPPGVNPQHYAPGGQPHQMHQQVPVQHQQIPVQHQQMPVQHQQIPMQHQQMHGHPQQVPMQHVPMQHQQQQVVMQPPQHQQFAQQQAHHGHHPGGHQQVLNVANMAQEKDHLKDHLNADIDTSNMSEQELQFHYFKLHDADNNNKLDGCELIKSLIHWHEQGHHHDPAAAQLPPEQKGSKLFTDQELVSLIDPILSMDDTNRDGFIDYPEFVQAQHKAAAQVKA